MSSARDVIASLLEDEFGRHADEQADAIIAGLEASGRAIVHKDEIHAPSVERAIAVAAGKSEEFDFQKALAECRDSEHGFHSGRLHAAAALHELMKEVGR